MSLMSKLLITILALSSLSYADAGDVEEFLQKAIGKNPNIKSLNVEVVDTIELDKPKGWKAYIVQMTGRAKGPDGKEQDISQRSVYFSGDGVVTSELHNMATGKKISVSPEFNPKFYDEQHRIFGNLNAKHKIVLFSDPLCPFCKSFVPGALKYLKKYPKTFVVYYYHFPLASLHPAAVTLVHAAAAAEFQGRKDVVEKLYTVKIGSREANQQKIIDAFNKAENTNLKLTDISAVGVQKHIQHDMKVAEEHLINGTPTMFVDGKKDGSKLLFKKLKTVE